MVYAETERYTLYQGKMQDELNNLESNSVDCIITDPPYELGFMNKSWDSTGVAFQKSTWEKCLRVLKPGGYLLSFGGSRTFHRIVCAIEDVGFEIRDTIMWIFGCYSEDTQVLTNNGWKYFYDLDKTDMVLQWDKSTNKLSWIKPLNYFEYDIDDELCVFENRHISQMVTKNHKVACQIKARRKDFSEYQLIEAQDIKPSWILNFPLAGELDGYITESDAYIIGWWLTDAYRHKDGKACMFTQSKPHTLSKLRNWFDEHNVKYSEYVRHYSNPNHRDEHTFYVTGQLADKLLASYPNRELTWDVLNWDTNSRKALLDGLMDGDGSFRHHQYAKTFWSQKQERLDIFQALCISLNYRASISDKGCVNFNIAHNSTQTQTKHHKANIPYKGKVYCLETETGAFVVRRNGKAFISGNSGFPKSMNIGLAIDKKLGVESEVGGVKPGHQDFVNRTTDGDTKFEGGMEGFDRPWLHDVKKREMYHYEKIPVSELAKNWQGWGTSLKPSFEPIIVARKPLDGTCVDNILKWNVGGINIDECRVETCETLVHGGKLNKSPADDRTGRALGMFADGTENKFIQNPNGRFPANTILTYDEEDFDEVCGGFPSTKSTGGCGEASIKSGLNGSVYMGGWSHDTPGSHIGGLGDTGSAARYFYCAKASKADREEGLESSDGKRVNVHPTVKPTSLMRYLIRLVAPKDAVILDPFMGSGSTGKAAMIESNAYNKNYKFIGIEMTESYLPISQARIEYGINYIDEESSKKSIKSQTAKPIPTDKPKSSNKKLF